MTDINLKDPATLDSVTQQLRTYNKAVRFERMMNLAKGLEAVPTAVAYPCDKESLGGALGAAKAGLIKPLLIGPEAKIREVAAQCGYDLAGAEVIDAAGPVPAAAKAVALVREGKAEILMKGSLHTDELLSAVVRSDTGIRTKRRISHVFVMDVPAYHKPLLVADAAINIAPTLPEKADILQNTIELAHIMGIEKPKVAIISAVETINAKMQSTLDAAALCKMADRGQQLTGAIVDGPMAFDNAISKTACEIKKLNSPVGGDADILLAPDLITGNTMAKQMEYFGQAAGAGVVLGALVPIVLTSRADVAETRMASAAIAAAMAHYYRKNKR